MFIAYYTIRGEIINVFGVKDPDIEGNEFDYFDLFDADENCLNEGEPLYLANIREGKEQYVVYDGKNDYELPSEFGVRFFLEKIGHWKHLTPEVTAKLAEIAKKECGVPYLDERGMDSLDFHDVGALGLRAALEAAYVLNRE